jgi:hypothetical protein
MEAALAVPVALAHQRSRVARPPKASVLVAVAAQPSAQPRARRATRAVWPRDRPTNTHVARDLWNSDARTLLLSETINAAGGLNQRFAESAAFDRVDRVMPAGAFAASGPSGQTRSKTRSRIAQVRAARVWRVSSPDFARVGSISTRGFAGGQNCREKFLG